MRGGAWPHAESVQEAHFMSLLGARVSRASSFQRVVNE